MGGSLMIKLLASLKQLIREISIMPDFTDIQWEDYMIKLRASDNIRRYLARFDLGDQLMYFLSTAGIDEITGKEIDSVNNFSFSTTKSHCNRINDILQLNVEKFCEEIIQAVEKWLSIAKNNPNVQAYMSKLLEVHEGGYSPMPGVWIG
jgi:hypothetical protein